MRINKYLALCGLCSRRGADELVDDGRVEVNGQMLLDKSYRVQEGDEVSVDGQTVWPEDPRRVILVNKPSKVLCSAYDPQERELIYDILPEEFATWPYVGRLDFMTSGLILLTPDGELSRRLTLPSYDISRRYSARLDKELQLEDMQAIRQGVDLPAEGKAPAIRTRPAKISAEGRDTILTLKEGRYREIRRIFNTLGYKVKDLVRLSYGPLTLEGSEPGEWRELAPEEVDELYKLVNLT